MESNEPRFGLFLSDWLRQRRCHNAARFRLDGPDDTTGWICTGPCKMGDKSLHLMACVSCLRDKIAIVLNLNRPFHLLASCQPGSAKLPRCVVRHCSDGLHCALPFTSPTYTTVGRQLRQSGTKHRAGRIEGVSLQRAPGTFVSCFFCPLSCAASVPTRRGRLCRGLC